MSSGKVLSVLLVLLFNVFLIEVLGSEEELVLERVKRGSAYAGGYGGAAPKLSPSVALGTYGGFVGHRQGGGGGKLTVQEALGRYGGFVRGGHSGPTVLGSGGDIFNKGGHPSK